MLTIPDDFSNRSLNGDTDKLVVAHLYYDDTNLSLIHI